LLALFLHQSCSSWNNGHLYPEVSWSESGNKILIYQVSYLETSSWNPLDGTTNKKNYETRLRLSKFESGKLIDPSIFDKKFPFWILPRNVFYSEKSDSIFFIEGLDNVGFATEARAISILKSEMKEPKKIWNSSKEYNLWKILPSPDETKIAIIVSKLNAEKVQAFEFGLIDIQTGNTKYIPISFWFDSNEYGLSWDPNSKSIYVLLKEKVFIINTSLEKLALQNTSSFPECFEPGTSFGNRASHKQEILKFLSIENFTSSITIEVDETFTPYSKIKKSGKLSKSCN
jgi:hypothetical protein